MINKYYLISDNDITSSIQMLSSKLSNLKIGYFKSILMYKKFDKSDVKKINAEINSFLGFWESYSDYIGEKIKISKGKENITTIDYQYIKEFIYANYDYASVLQFVDGVIKGIESKKFVNTEDIEDFKKHVLAKAFNDRPDTVGGLLDSVLVNGSGLDVLVDTTMIDVKLYNSIRTYPKLFDKKSRVELYKSSEKILEFLTLAVEKFRSNDPDESKLLISMISNSIDVIAYSLTAYATRIYIIGRYTYPFISDGEQKRPDSFAESMDIKGDFKSTKEPIMVFRNADEALYRDVKNVDKFLKLFNEFLKMIGSGNPHFIDIDDMNINNIIKSNNGNLFCSKLIGNSLHIFFNQYGFNLYRSNPEIVIEELYQNIKEMLYNNQHGIQMDSPKQELLNIIRYTKSDNTIKGQLKLAEDLFTCSIPICIKINTLITDLLVWSKDSVNNYIGGHNVHITNKVLAVVQMLNDFYSEYINEVITKGREIEDNINGLASTEINDVLKGFKINLSPLLKEDVNVMEMEDKFSIAVLMETYEIPMHESLEMYDEYVKSLEYFHDDLYFSEAISISSLINTIISKLKALWERMKAFINNKYFQLAVDWVTKHEKELLASNFNDASMDILKYKNKVTLPNGFNNLANNLLKFDSKVISSQESLNAYIKSLYPNENIYKWFTQQNNSEKNNGAVMYRNLILFQDEGSVNTNEQKEVRIKGTEINTHLKEWINTIKESKKTLEDFKKINDEIENNVNSVKSKIVNITNQQNRSSDNGTTSSVNNTQQSNNNDNPPSSMEENKNKPANNNQASAQNKNNEQHSESNNSELINTALTEILVTITRIWGSLTPIFIEYMKTEYSYIKMAWSIGRR